MDELHPPPAQRSAPDLASIVLASAGREQRAARPVRARRPRPQPVLLHEPAGRRTELSSLVLLLLVLLTLVGMVVLTISIGRDGAGGAGSALVGGGSELEAAGVDAAAVVGREAVDGTRSAAAATPRFVDGVDLRPGRVTAMGAATGGTVVRVAVTNRGTDALVAGSGAEVVVLLDGSPVGTAQIDSVEPRGGRGTIDVPLASCTSGTAVLTVLLRSEDVDATNDVVNRRTRMPC